MSIHAIWGPPRSGKTTIAIDLAHALARRKKSVCLISLELYSELSARMSIKIPPEKSLSAAYKTTESLKSIVYPVSEFLYVLAVPSYNDAFHEEISSDEAKDLLRMANSLFDYIIVDCPSHTGSVQAAWALNLSEVVILISGNKPADILWYGAFSRALDRVAPHSIPVCVEVNANFDYAALHNMLKLAPEVWIPHYKNAEMLQNIRPTLYRTGDIRSRKYSASIDEICMKVEGKLA